MADEETVLDTVLSDTALSDAEARTVRLAVLDPDTPEALRTQLTNQWAAADPDNTTGWREVIAEECLGLRPDVWSYVGYPAGVTGGDGSTGSSPYHDALAELRATTDTVTSIRPVRAVEEALAGRDEATADELLEAGRQGLRYFEVWLPLLRQVSSVGAKSPQEALARYDRERGMSFAALLADASTVQSCADELALVVLGLEGSVGPLEASWSGRTAQAAVVYLREHGGAAATVRTGVDAAAETLRTAAGELHSAVQEKALMVARLYTGEIDGKSERQVQDIVTVLCTEAGRGDADAAIRGMGSWWAPVAPMLTDVDGGNLPDEVRSAVRSVCRAWVDGTFERLVNGAWADFCETCDVTTEAVEQIYGLLDVALREPTAEVFTPLSGGVVVPPPPRQDPAPPPPLIGSGPGGPGGDPQPPGGDHTAQGPPSTGVPPLPSPAPAASGPSAVPEAVAASPVGPLPQGETSPGISPTRPTVPTGLLESDGRGDAGSSPGLMDRIVETVPTRDELVDPAPDHAAIGVDRPGGIDDPALDDPAPGDLPATEPGPHITVTDDGVRMEITAPAGQGTGAEVTVTDAQGATTAYRIEIGPDGEPVLTTVEPAGFFASAPGDAPPVTGAAVAGEGGDTPPVQPPAEVREPATVSPAAAADLAVPATPAAAPHDVSAPVSASAADLAAAAADAPTAVRAASVSDAAEALGARAEVAGPGTGATLAGDSPSASSGASLAGAGGDVGAAGQQPDGEAGAGASQSGAAQSGGVPMGPVGGAGAAGGGQGDGGIERANPWGLLDEIVPDGSTWSTITEVLGAGRAAPDDAGAPGPDR